VKLPRDRLKGRRLHRIPKRSRPAAPMGTIGRALEKPVPKEARLSPYGGRPLSDDDAARLRERLLVSRAIEELRRAHRYPQREDSAEPARPPACQFFNVTQIRSIGSLPMLPDSCPSLSSMLGIHPTPPSGDGSG
jgi:hypothetical protein